MNNDVFIHPTAVVDEGATLGEGTKVWHFSHIMSDAVVGERCNIGQNVVISPGVILGSNVKIQNNVSLYTGVICDDDVFLGPSCVLPMLSTPDLRSTDAGNMPKPGWAGVPALEPMLPLCAGMISVNLHSLAQVRWSPNKSPTTPWSLAIRPGKWAG